MEILKNTILKLIYRQGTDTQRQHIVFDLGEPIYTTDSERLYIGNGILSGGNIASNLFLGYSTDVTTFSNAEVGDVAFDINSNKLYGLSATPSNDIENWANVGGVYHASDNKISIDSSNLISINEEFLAYATLSSNWENTHTQVNSLSTNWNNSYNQVTSLSSNWNNSYNQVKSLSSNWNNSYNQVTSLSSNWQNTYSQVNSLSTNWNNSYNQVTSLSSDWQNTYAQMSGVVLTNTITLSSGVVGYEGISPITNFNPLEKSVNIRLKRIMAKYDSELSSFSTENITTSTRLSAGHYNFTYSPIDSLQIPLVQTINNMDILLYPRVISNTLSSCDVVVLSSNLSTVDKDFVLKIDY